jgi:hypothetical protein
MIHTLGGDHIPKELNFSIKGKLSINDTVFDICLGQGHTDSKNNWHLASPDINSDTNGKNGVIGGKYRLSQDGSHSLIVQVVS